MIAAYRFDGDRTVAQPAHAHKAAPRINKAGAFLETIERLMDHNRALAEQNETLRINMNALHRTLIIQNHQLDEQYALFRAALDAGRVPPMSGMW